MWVWGGARARIGVVVVVGECGGKCGGECVARFQRPNREVAKRDNEEITRHTATAQHTHTTQ